MTTKRTKMLRTSVLIAACSLVPLDVLPAVEIHVGVNGSDEGAGTKERPFGTITRARDSVRELKRQRTFDESVEVVFHGGTYFLPETVLLTAEDSGTARTPVVYRAADGERVVLSGGRRIE